MFVTPPHDGTVIGVIAHKTQPETSFRDLHVRLVGLCWEQRLRRIRKEGPEREEHRHHRPLTLQQPPNFVRHFPQI